MLQKQGLRSILAEDDMAPPVNCYTNTAAQHWYEDSSCHDLTHCRNCHNWLEKQADSWAHTPRADNAGKLNRASALLFVRKSRMRLTVVTVNCIWHGAALISRASLSIHLGGSLPGVVPPSNLGTRRPVTTKKDVRLLGMPGGASWERWKLETTCCVLTTGPIGLLVMGFPTNGSLWQVVSPFSLSSALTIKTSPRFKAFLGCPRAVKVIRLSELFISRVVRVFFFLLFFF